MAEEKKRARKFEDIKVWRKAHELVLLVYKLTRSLPREELFGLTSQMRRAAVSVAANIAEGFTRRGIKDKLNFYNTSESSLEELRYYFILCKDLGYIASNEEPLSRSEEVGKMLAGWCDSIRTNRAIK